MREIEERIAAWREEIAGIGGIDPKTVRELESHLRDVIDAEMADGADPADAFETSVAQLGPSAELGAEFDKVYPEVSWSRRVLWLAAGYGFVSSCILLTVWVGVLIKQYAMLVFPDWKLNLSTPFVIERDPSHFLFAALPENGLRVAELPMGIVLGAIAQLLATVGFAVISVRIVRGNSRLFERLRSGGRPLALFAIIACALSFALRTRFGSRLLHSLPGIKGLEMGEFFSELQYWMNLKLSWAHWTLLIGLAFWGILYLRRCGVADHRAWMMSGYFLIGALVFLTKLIGIFVGLMASLCFPDLLDSYAQTWNGIGYFVSTPAGGVSMVTEVFALILIITITALLVMRKRSLRADRLVAGLARYSLPLLVLWSLCFLFPWVGGASVPKPVVERLALVWSPTIYPLAPILGIVFIAAALFATRKSMGLPKDSQGETA